MALSGSDFMSNAGGSAFGGLFEPHAAASNVSPVIPIAAIVDLSMRISLLERQARLAPATDSVAF
jgi:hypothetical protein